jgi:NADH-quinone oxidoreductase subunit C
MDLSAIVNLLQEKLGPHISIGTDTNATPQAILVPAPHIAEICQVLHEHPHMYFDYLACITALDNGPEKGTLEIIYNLYSIPYNLQLMIKVIVVRNKLDEPLPTIPTVSHIWQAANWHEREAYDLLGIHFSGHPDLRRILLPADWEGYPLRTDYVHQQRYHGIRVEY